MARHDDDDDDDSPAHCGTGRTRLYVDQSLTPGTLIELNKDQSHYLVNVLRLEEGAYVQLFNNREGEFLAHIEERSKKACSLFVEQHLRPHAPLPDIWLLFAPVKKARLDFIAQKATELGAARIQPVITQRTTVSRVKDERLAANVIEAAEQCGMVALPEVGPTARLADVLDHWSEVAGERMILFCDEAAPSGGVKAQLDTLVAKGMKGAPLALLIGPEGGFSPEERARLLARKDTCAISLGPRIMRADTAAIAALAVIGLMLGDW